MYIYICIYMYITIYKLFTLSFFPAQLITSSSDEIVVG